MREILFRGKLLAGTSAGEWVYGNLDVKPGQNVAIITPDDTLIGKYGRVATDTVGQYTGLTDKNGTRIFEGDIVKCRSGRICKVVYFVKTNISTFDLDPIAGFDCPPPEKWDLWSGAEVVGNIHDNPDLTA